MTKVVVPNGDVDAALKKLKVKVAKSGVPSEVKKRKHYKKPGVERRERKEEMKRNSRKKHRRDYLEKSVLDKHFFSYN